MKKLKLGELDLGDAEMLTREQLKKVLGGMGSESGSGTGCKNLQMQCEETTNNCCSKCCQKTTKGYYHCVHTSYCMA